MITIELAESDAVEVLRALMCRQNDLSSLIQSYAKDKNIDQVVRLSDMYKSIGNTLTNLMMHGVNLE